MIVTYIRSSSYNNYDYCQMQYFITYVLGHQSPSMKKADLGTICHKVFETLANLKKRLQDSTGRQKYLEINDDAIGKYKIDKNNFLLEETWQDILQKSFDFYTKDSTHSWTKGDFSKCQSLIKETLAFNAGQFDPRYRKIIAPEPHFDIPIEEEWAKFTYEINGEKIDGQLAIKGTIDLVTEVSEDVIEVIDWKTGKRIDWASGEEKDHKKLKNDAQLLLYHYAISKLFPNYKQAIMSIFFVKDDPPGNRAPFSLCFDQGDKDKFLSMLRKRFEEIKVNKSPKPISLNRDHWKCTRLCHFCKNNWPGSDKNMCIYIEDHLKKHGIDKTVKECTRENFSIGYYESPG